MKAAVWAASLGAICASAQFRSPPGFEDGSDLESFVTRPEIKAPKYMVAKYHPEAISDGYWFITPYTSLEGWGKSDRKEHIPCQTGPTIYDGNGTLVWSGACQYHNKHIFNFKPITVAGTQHLKFYLPPNRDSFDEVPEIEKLESGIMLNNQYEEIKRTTLKGLKNLDSHEFRPQPNGKQALVALNWVTDRKAIELDQGERSFVQNGFQEIDMTTGKPLFDWDPWFHGVMTNESCDTKGMHNLNEPWDWAHINSIDKNFGGDYLISLRHTSTIYKISGKDGSVKWRLGGCANMSDFTMEDGVQFYWQHHARYRFENATHTVISLFDNQSEDWQDRNPDIPQSRSVGKIIMLDHREHTAKILRRFDRPDGETSNALGSLQTIGSNVQNASVLIDWAWQGYIGEYDGKDRLVMEAKFMSNRHRTYRAHKYPWVGRPVEPPVLKVLPIGHTIDDVASAFYVSWNGATEVAAWAFYGGNALDEPFQLLATVKKQGFETSWVLAGAVKFAYAEAIDAEGQVLGKSTTASIIPSGHGDFKLNSPLLKDVVAFDLAPVVPKTGSLSVCKSTAPSSGLLSYLFTSVIGVLALFGAFGVARRILDEVLRRQQGYRPSKDDGQRHGRPRIPPARLNSGSDYRRAAKLAEVKSVEAFDTEKQLHEMDWDAFCDRRYSTSSSRSDEVVSK